MNPLTVAQQTPHLPGQNAGVGCHLLLQGISLTQGSNPHLPHCRRILYCLSPRELTDPHLSCLPCAKQCANTLLPKALNLPHNATRQALRYTQPQVREVNHREAKAAAFCEREFTPRSLAPASVLTKPATARLPRAQYVRSPAREPRPPSPRLPRRPPEDGKRPSPKTGRKSALRNAVDAPRPVPGPAGRSRAPARLVTALLPRVQ